MEELLKRVIWGNTVMDYSIALGSMLLLWIIVRIFQNRVIHYLQHFSAKTDTIFDDLVLKGFKKLLLPFIYLAGNIMIIRQLVLPPKLDNILKVTLIVIATYYIVRLVNFIIHGGVHVYMERRNEPKERVRQLRGILMVIYACIWIVGIIMMIDNLGFDITTIIAGLGVGGIAVALAAQNILGDLFSYLVIFFDKPFEIGDFIKTSTGSGTVERIGIKTSHLRSPDGQQLVMPNAELVKSVIQNFKRLERRRVLMNIGVVYQTPAEKLRKTPTMIEEIIRSQQYASFDRVHLKTLGDFSLVFEVVFFIESTEYGVYMDSQQEILFKIFEKFESEGISFAYPTQTIVFEKANDEKNSTSKIRAFPADHVE